MYFYPLIKFNLTIFLFESFCENKLKKTLIGNFLFHILVIKILVSNYIFRFEAILIFLDIKIFFQISKIYISKCDATDFINRLYQHTSPADFSNIFHKLFDFFFEAILI